MPAGAKTSMAYPFSRLRTDRFWHRIPKPGYDPDIEYNVSSMERLQEMYFGARMDDELISWSESRDDRPTNGLALCRLCHWSFDEGLMSVGGKLRGAGFAAGQNGSKHARAHADAGRPHDLPPCQRALLAGPGQP